MKKEHFLICDEIIEGIENMTSENLIDNKI